MEFAIQLPLPDREGLRVLMNRRRFLASSGVAALATFVPSVSRFALAEVPNKIFEWKTNDLIFTFEVTAGKLRQKRMVPVGASPSCRGFLWRRGGPSVQRRELSRSGNEIRHGAARGPAYFCWHA